VFIFGSDMKIKQYIYTSTATKLMTDEELNEMLVSSRKYNKENDITGFLLYCGGTFLQVLECKQDILVEVLARIRKSSKHKDINNLVTIDRDEREFPDWAMGVRHSKNPEVIGRLYALQHTKKNNESIAMNLVKYVAEIND
jgi:hypothetical protein